MEDYSWITNDMFDNALMHVFADQVGGEPEKIKSLMLDTPELYEPVKEKFNDAALDWCEKHYITPEEQCILEAMAEQFMKPYVYEANALIVGGRPLEEVEGIDLVDLQEYLEQFPYEARTLSDYLEACHEGGLRGEDYDALERSVFDFAEAQDIVVDSDTVEYRKGVWLARLTAPGYMDSTDTTVHDTHSEAAKHLIEMYGDDTELDNDRQPSP